MRGQRHHDHRHHSRTEQDAVAKAGHDNRILARRRIRN
jgi:hypothetical protein